MILGLVAPFVSYWVVVQAFFLLVPFLIVLLLSLVVITVAFIEKKSDKQKMVFFCSLLPLFVGSQLLSVFVVNKIQRKRSEAVISILQKSKVETGKVPESIPTSLGIKYIRLTNGQDFEIFYSRGFLITEKYHSHNNRWRSYGWND